MVEFLNRYVGIKKEATYGTVATGAITTFEHGEVDDESFATRMDMLTRQDMSRAIVSKSVTGTEYSEGGLNMAMQIDDFTGNVLAAFFPATSYANSTHTFEEPSTTSHSYKSYTFTVGREDREITYKGMVANTLSVNANVGEYVMMSADFVGQRELVRTVGTAYTSSGSQTSLVLATGQGAGLHTAGTGHVGGIAFTWSALSGDTLTLSGDLGTSQAVGAVVEIDPQTVTYAGDAVDALYFANGEVKFDDVTGDAPAASASVKSVDFQISLNPDTDNAYAIGDSTYGSQPKMQRREITGTVEFNKVLYGDQTLDEPDYSALVSTDGLDYSTVDDAPTMVLKFADEAGTNHITFHFYHIRWETPTANVSGRDTNTMSVGFVALYDATTSGAGKAMNVTMRGSDKTSAY